MPAHFLKRSTLGLIIACVVLLTGCATAVHKSPVDYSAFEKSNPKSILVLPPVNETPEPIAEAGVLSSITSPLAEFGYYVLPIGLTQEVLKANGIADATEAHDIPLDKLHKIFGTDAVLYLTAKQYGTIYRVVQSNTEVSVEGKLVDARSGEKLWQGKSSASSSENQNNSGNLAVMLIVALVDQIVDSTFDKAQQIAAIANARLVYSPPWLQGSRSPLYNLKKMTEPAQLSSSNSNAAVKTALEKANNITQEDILKLHAEDSKQK